MNKAAREVRRRTAPLEKELLRLERQETKMAAAAVRKAVPGWRTKLENRIPTKVRQGLESTFAKGFSLVFQQGRGLIERTCDKEGIQQAYRIRSYAIRIKGGAKELRQLRRGASQSSLRNLSLTTAEGIALGLLGIGLPDIVLFLGTLLRGVYEAALNYGFSYATIQEQYLILKMMEASLSPGEDWQKRNDEVNRSLWDKPEITDEVLREQLQRTAAAFAMDMLLLKLLQGIPVVGLIGGAANPFYYNKVMRYVQLKYNKRYLLQLQWNEAGQCPLDGKGKEPGI